MRLRGVTLGLLGGLAITCSENLTGEPCSDAPNACIDHDTILACRDGAWSEDPCARHCEDDQIAVGCVRNEESDFCECREPSPPCEEGLLGRCTANGAEASCVDGAIVEIPCFEVCAETLETPLPTGCFLDLETEIEGCVCVNEGAGCSEPAPPQCASDETLAECVDGVWVETACADQCDGEAATCVYDYVQDEGVCSCEG